MIVMAILGMAAALATVAWWPRETNGAISHPRSSNEVVTHARRQAVARGEVLIVQLNADGRWQMRSRRTGTLLSDGQVPNEAPLSLEIDPLGSCRPVSEPHSEARLPETFDLTRCRWSVAASASASALVDDVEDSP